MTDGGYAWTDEGERTVYRRAVLDCLDDHRLSELLERRPAVTREVVAEAMCAAPYVGRVLEGEGPRVWHRCYRWVHRVGAPYRWVMPARESPRELLGDDDVTWRLMLGGLTAAWIAVFRDWWSLAAGGALLLLVGIPLRRFLRRVVRGLPAPRKRAAQAVALAPWAFVLWLVDEWAKARWLGEMRGNGLDREVARAVEDFLGEDAGTLLVTSAHEGLSSPRHRSYFVGIGPAVELERKMSQLSGGAIALSGPRGVGKTTLMEHSVRERDFAVFAHAPATYTPYDFLTSLFVSVCRAYVIRAGYSAPEFVRLSYLRRLGRPFRRLSGRLAHVLVAVALLALGLFGATRRSLDDVQGAWVRRLLVPGWERVAGFVEDLFAGARPTVALCLALAAVLSLAVREYRVTAYVLRQAGKALTLLVTSGLLLGALLLLGWTSPWPVVVALAWVVCWYFYLDASTRPTLRIGQWAGDKGRLFGPPTKLLPFLFVALLLYDESARTPVADNHHAVSLGLLMLGVLLFNHERGAFSLPHPPPPLVTACRNHLYRLQTVQSSSAGLTTGATRFLALGSAHSTSLTTVPPNYPALVGEFRALLAEIGRDEHTKGNRVVVAIDEVDRLGSDTQALAFLAEIKAILGVPHVHYLISVAEDVGAAFVRRGLPNRDVTDSSLDDVVHVRRCTLAESAEILRARAPGIGDAYIVLAHALSGGIPRDLIRYGRRLLEIRLVTEQVELPDVAQTLIIEELSETLAGFRTLLAKQHWTPGTQGVLGSFRSLAAHLRVACPCPEPVEQLRGALTHFVAYEVDGLPEESRGLIDEAAAYAYLSLTLLDIFGAPGFTLRRAEAARRSPDGNPDLLAEARQELAVSPYSARPVIDGIRRAWLLEPVSGQGPRPAVTIPPPRGTACTAGHRPVG
ncbi:hypothetical protein ACYF6T_24960 [Streptomyces sp. 7R007]